MLGKSTEKLNDQNCSIELKTKSSDLEAKNVNSISGCNLINSDGSPTSLELKLFLHKKLKGVEDELTDPQAFSNFRVRIS